MHKEEGATAWFEALYKKHYLDESNIPWAKMQANDFLEDYIANNAPCGKALVVGCGLGDDAVALNLAGFDVTAIDISASAIKWCKKRFDGYGIDFKVQDLFNVSEDLLEQFDFVFECQTIQSLPLALRDKTITAISSLVAPKGQLLVVAHGKNEQETFEGPPWPLTQNEVKLFTMKKMKQLEFSIFDNPSGLANFRFRAVFQKEA